MHSWTIPAAGIRGFACSFPGFGLAVNDSSGISQPGSCRRTTPWSYPSNNGSQELLCMILTLCWYYTVIEIGKAILLRTAYQWWGHSTMQCQLIRNHQRSTTPRPSLDSCKDERLQWKNSPCEISGEFGDRRCSLRLQGLPR